MKINFKKNYCILVLILLLILSCLFFVETTKKKELFNNRFNLPESFKQNFRKLGEKDNYSYYLLDNSMKNFYLKNRRRISELDRQFSITKKLDSKKDRVDYPNLLDNNYNFYYTDETDILFRNYKTTNQPSLPILVDLNSTSMHTNISENVNLLVLLYNEQNYGNDIKVYDLSKNVLSIDLKIDNKLIILNGEIVGTRLKDNDNENDENNSDSLSISYPKAMLQYLYGLHTKDSDLVDMNIINKSLKSNASYINNQSMLTGKHRDFSYNSPYYNNSFEYAMNSLSNPIINNLETKDPSDFSQMLLDKKNIKDVSHICNNKDSSCGCCSSRDKIPKVTNKIEKNIEKNIDKNNSKKIQNKINESSKIGRKFSALDSNMTMFNTTADLNDKTQKNFTPELAKHSSEENVPRPMLTNFSNF
tara:strand:- start:242 stop:1495 length:1254 start_codon:yes stop_codon:yes gene_type:complete